MLRKTGILYFTTCFHGFDILRHVDPIVRMLHIFHESISYIHPPKISRVCAECSPLLQLIKLINDLKNDESDTILQQIEMRYNSYRTFSFL